MMQNHGKYRRIISAKKTRSNTTLLFKCDVILFIFHTFYEVWRRAQEHRKLRHFSTAKKTQENTKVLYRLSVILYSRRVFDIYIYIYIYIYIFVVVCFLTVKLGDSNRSKIHVFYHSKLKVGIMTSSTSATELHFVCQICTFHRVCMAFDGAKRQQ